MGTTLLAPERHADVCAPVLGDAVRQTARLFQENWLQVLASTKRAEIEEREGQEFEAKVMALLGLKA